MRRISGIVSTHPRWFSCSGSCVRGVESWNTFAGCHQHFRWLHSWTCGDSHCACSAQWPFITKTVLSEAHSLQKMLQVVSCEAVAHDSSKDGQQNPQWLFMKNLVQQGQRQLVKSMRLPLSGVYSREYWPMDKESRKC